MGNQNMRALVVDDLSPMRKIAKNMLRKMERFEVIDEASDGEQAWELVCRCEDSKIYDLVICDIKMAGGSGIELLKRCREDPRFHLMPFLMISASSEESNLASTLGEWGANDFIVKPFPFELLERRIVSLLQRLDDPEENLFRRMEQLKQSGSAREALELIEEAELQGRLSLAKWINAKGECLMASGDIEGAKNEFKKAMGISKIFLVAYKNYAVAQQKTGNIEDAVKTLEYIQKISPADIDRKLLLGKLLLQSGRKEKGAACLESAFNQCDDKNKEALINKVAQIFLEGGLFEEAEKMYMLCLEINPSDSETLNRLGMVFRQQGKYDQATQYYLHAIKREPDNPVLHLNLAIIYMNQKNLRAALTCLKKALALDPRYEEAKAMLGNIEQMESSKK